MDLCFIKWPICESYTFWFWNRGGSYFNASYFYILFII